MCLQGLGITVDCVGFKLLEKGKNEVKREIHSVAWRLNFHCESMGTGFELTVGVHHLKSKHKLEENAIFDKERDVASTEGVLCLGAISI